MRVEKVCVKFLVTYDATTNSPCGPGEYKIIWEENLEVYQKSHKDIFYAPLKYGRESADILYQETQFLFCLSQIGFLHIPFLNYSLSSICFSLIGYLNVKWPENMIT